MTSPGLRERKKARTRAAIREHAMRLFQEQGYAATTVDQIAEAADVSQSTFFRYFPTKEDVVLADDFDPLLVQAVRDQPAELHPVEAIKLGIRHVFAGISAEDWEQERRRLRLVQSVPELRARSLHQYAAAISLLSAVVAERAGLPAEDFSARVLAGAVIGACLAAISQDGEMGLGEGGVEPLERALDLLRDGLPLG
jgi:AcrR family transcriptional regulator